MIDFVMLFALWLALGFVYILLGDDPVDAMTLAAAVACLAGIADVRNALRKKS